MIKEIKNLGCSIDENSFQPFVTIKVVMEVPMQKVWDDVMTEEEMVGEIAKSIMEFIKANPR